MRKYKITAQDGTEQVLDIGGIIAAIAARKGLQNAREGLDTCVDIPDHFVKAHIEAVVQEIKEVPAFLLIEKYKEMFGNPVITTVPKPKHIRNTMGISVSLTIDMVSKLHNYCNDNNVTMSQVVAKLLDTIL